MIFIFLLEENFYYNALGENIRPLETLAVPPLYIYHRGIVVANNLCFLVKVRDHFVEFFSTPPIDSSPPVAALQTILTLMP